MGMVLPSYIMGISFLYGWYILPIQIYFKEIKFIILKKNYSFLYTYIKIINIIIYYLNYYLFLYTLIKIININR